MHSSPATKNPQSEARRDKKAEMRPPTGSAMAAHSLRKSWKAAKSNTGRRMAPNKRKTAKHPSAFLMSALPASTSSAPPERKPPTMGTEPETRYFAARREMPSYCAAAMPCTVRNIPRMPRASPIIHLLTLLKKSPSFAVLTSSERLPANARTMTATDVGRTTEVNISHTAPERKATAGRKIPAETAPPLAAISVRSSG